MLRYFSTLHDSLNKTAVAFFDTSNYCVLQMCGHVSSFRREEEFRIFHYLKYILKNKYMTMQFLLLYMLFFIL